MGWQNSILLQIERFLWRQETAHCPLRIVLLHYAPTSDTLHGEPEGIWTYLGCDRLAVPIAEYRPDIVLHGHAHAGSFEGAIGPVPVYNVAVHVTGRDFYVFELGPHEVEVETMALEQLAGLAEIAEMLRVSRSTAARYAERADFPAPSGRLGRGRIWRRREVEKWGRLRLPLPKPGRPPKTPKHG